MSTKDGILLDISLPLAFLSLTMLYRSFHVHLIRPVSLEKLFYDVLVTVAAQEITHQPSGLKQQFSLSHGFHVSGMWEGLN